MEGRSSSSLLNDARLSLSIQPSGRMQVSAGAHAQGYILVKMVTQHEIHLVLNTHCQQLLTLCIPPASRKFPAE